MANNYWSASSDWGCGNGLVAKANASAGLMTALDTLHRTPPQSLGLGVHFIGGGTRPGATGVLGGIALALVGNAGLLLTLLPAIYTRAATREAICLPVVIDELVV